MAKLDEIRIERIESEEIDQKTPSKDVKLYTYPADFTLEVLVKKIEDKEIEIPPFQRKYVWDPIRASRLIESFMLGLPVPQVYLFVNDKGKLLIVDGQQRLITIKSFFSGLFESGKPFKLKLEPTSRLNNKNYQGFSEKEKRDFKNITLRSIIIKPPEDSEEYDEVLASIFERLNTGGILLRNQEIRNCVFAGRMVDALHDINGLDKWRKILGNTQPDKYQRDVEMILRFLAIYFSFDSYRSPMKNFLSIFLKSNINPTDSKLQQMKTLFSNTIKEVIDKLGEKPFHKRAGMNIAIFDAVTIVFARNLGKLPKDINERYKNLLNDQRFLELTEKHTTDKNVINGRIEIAEKYLVK